MQHRIFHKILVPILAICLIAPFFVSHTYADTTGGNFSVTSRVEYIRGYTENGGSYDWTTNIITTVNFYMPFTGQFRLRTDGVNPIFVTGRANVDGAVLLTVGENGLYVDFQASECSSFTYTQTYDYKTGYSTNIYGSVLNGAYQNGTIMQYIDGIETSLSNIEYYVDGVESTLNDILNNLDNYEMLLTSLEIPDYQISIWRILTQNDPSKIGANYFGKFVTYTDDITLTNYMRSGENYVMIYASGTTNIYPVFQETDVTSEIVRTVRSYNNVFYVIRLSTSSSGTKHFTFNNSSVNRYIYPYYYGWADYMPSELMSVAVDQFSDAYLIALKNLANGGTSTQSIVDDNDDKNDQLSDSITTYDNLENQFKSDFNTNMNQISKPSISNILQAASWYTTQLTNLFNASGSFQIIFTLPLVLGLALFFIGRGGVVFREGRTETIENRTYKQELSDGSTYTKTYRQRHWRKK